MICAVPALATMLSLSAAETWAIPDVDAADAMLGLGAQVTRQLVDAATAQGLTFLGPDQLRTMLTPEKYAALKRCHGGVACASQAVAGTPITRVVNGTLSRDDKHYLLRLWNHDVKNLTVVADVDRAILIASRRLQKDAEQAIPPLLRGEREARGTVTIEANIATAQIFVNGEFVGTPPTTLTLKPGKHEVKLEKTKYLPVSRLIDVEANQTKSEVFKLLLIPGQTPDLDPLTQQKAGNTETTASAGLTAPTFIFGGLAIAAGATSTVFGLMSSGQASRLLEGFDTVTGVYQGTRAQALEQNRNALIANISFITLGVAAAATIVFLIIDLVRAP